MMCDVRGIQGVAQLDLIFFVFLLLLDKIKILKNVTNEIVI